MLPPGLLGFQMARQQQAQEQSQGLNQLQGLLGVQGAMAQQQEMQRTGQLKGLLSEAIKTGDQNQIMGIMAQLDPKSVAANFMPKAPKWTATEIRNPDGTVKKGFVDINSQSPESTFRAMGVEPVKNEFVNGVPVNPFTQKDPIKNPNQPFSVGADGKVTPNLDFQNYEFNRAARGAPRSTTVVNPAIDPFKNEKSLRDEYSGNPIVKQANEMNAAFKLIDTAYKSPSPANDLAMATKYMKILDPNSVVRESELALAMGAVGLLDKVYNYAQMVAGGTKLTPNQRKDFYDSAKAINDEFQKGKSGVSNQYRRIANQYKLSPDNVTLEKDDGSSIFNQADAILDGR